MGTVRFGSMNCGSNRRFQPVQTMDWVVQLNYSWTASLNRSEPLLNRCLNHNLKPGLKIGKLPTSLPVSYRCHLIKFSIFIIYYLLLYLFILLLYSYFYLYYIFICLYNLCVQLFIFRFSITVVEIISK